MIAADTRTSNDIIVVAKTLSPMLQSSRFWLLYKNMMFLANIAPDIDEVKGNVSTLAYAIEN